MVVGGLFLAELVVEERVEVYQLVDAAVLPQTVVVEPHEVAIYQVVEQVAQVSVVGQFQFLRYFLPRQPLLAGSQQIDDVEVCLRVLVERIEQPAVFDAHLPVVREEEAVDVVGYALLRVEQTEIIRHSAHGGVQLERGKPRTLETVRLEVFLHLSEVERTEVHLVRHPVVQTALVVYHVAYHPRRGGTAYDELDVVYPAALTVPEKVQGMDESRLAGVETRQFVDEHNDGRRFPCGFLLQQLRQKGESLYPRLRFPALMSVIGEGDVERLHLLLRASLYDAGGVEIERVVEVTPYEKRLADAPSSVDGDKLRPVVARVFVEKSCFFLSANQFVHIVRSFCCGKDTNEYSKTTVILGESWVKKGGFRPR